MSATPTLTSLAHEADQKGFAKYAQYCRLREKKLRPEATAKLADFIFGMNEETAARQRAFADWVLTFAFKNPSLIDALPTSLRRDFIAPVIKSWTNDESENPKALRWSDDERALLVAARVHPPDEIAIGRYAASVINRIDFATHDPGLYVADEVGSDFAAVQTVLDLLNRVPESEFFESTREEALLLKLQLANAKRRQG